MSYQVLARKWRPRRFQEMVGQEHVLKALVNALDDDRLHHAYLFTGTRGVGKTSIARLFAKSLNCEQGISSEPCGQCSACREIAEGRFVDLIEVDAASRTKVEDTRELLENVQYAPTHGRFKVYLIDEVHMLSNSSFNALLKTLEEPPPHVKFLLATTDPQKLPVTVLSRCLQFNLKNLIPERIVEHLRHVLTEETIPFEEAALWLLARSADGSMRDALSLTDQAIAFGAGQVNENDVRAMLGTIDQRLVYRILEAVASQNGAEVLAASAELAGFSPDYNSVLGDLISLLHRVALAQLLPEAVDNSLGDLEQVRALAGRMRAEDVQLYYQIAVNGRRDLPYVPHAREGLEMILLRMLAFRPADAPATPVAAPEEAPERSASPHPPRPSSNGGEPSPAQAQTPTEPVSRPAEPQLPPAASPASSAHRSPAAETSAHTPPAATRASRQPPPMDEPPPWDEYEVASMEASVPAKKPEPEGTAVRQRESTPVPAPGAAIEQKIALAPSEAETSVEVAQVDPPTQLPQRLEELKPEHWVTLVVALEFNGMTDSLARSLTLEKVEAERLCFHYNAEQEMLLNDNQRERIAAALRQRFGAALTVEFQEAAQTRETPFQYAARRLRERKAEALQSLRQDPLVQQLVERFGARIDEESVTPLDLS